MRVYIGAVGGETQYMQGVLSLQDVTTRPGDGLQWLYNTSGALARGDHAETFINGEWDAILMIDLDMMHPPDLLERLREHDLDMVTAHYFRRQMPMLSVCSLIPEDNKWPYPPLLDIPSDGLHEISNTGMGCVLIKREVVQAVWDTLPKGDNPFYPGPMPKYSGDHRRWGSDFRFFTKARELGYKLWLDAGIESKHATTVWLDRDLYDRLDFRDRMQEQADKEYLEERVRTHGMDKKALEERIKQLAKSEQNQSSKVEQTRITLIQEERLLAGIKGQIAEVNHLLKMESENENKDE